MCSSGIPHICSKNGAQLTNNMLAIFINPRTSPLASTNIIFWCFSAASAITALWATSISHIPAKILYSLSSEPTIAVWIAVPLIWSYWTAMPTAFNASPCTLAPRWCTPAMKALSSTENSHRPHSGISSLQQAQELCWCPSGTISFTLTACTRLLVSNLIICWLCLSISWRLSSGYMPEQSSKTLPLPHAIASFLIRPGVCPLLAASLISLHRKAEMSLIVFLKKSI